MRKTNEQGGRYDGIYSRNDGMPGCLAKHFGCIPRKAAKDKGRLYQDRKAAFKVRYQTECQSRFVPSMRQ